ncbi:MAG TPA: peptidase [Deltaproteobacteria bacterium]|nr:MAG: peptidase [Deltaproteobacteria bacterium GWA2_45_12]HBF13304.1 peptidase [Deltaproteobacteria bacterium]
MKLHPFILIVLIVSTVAGFVAWEVTSVGAYGLMGAVLGLSFLFVCRVANQWQRAIVLRLGKFKELKGPGFFTIIPFVDTIPYCIDLRTITTPFTAEQTLTKDSVPVDVDAVLFWRVIDPAKAALEVENYKKAISWASQTALRDVIGETILADMLVGRAQIDSKLCQTIDASTKAWGIRVLSVELRDVKIPANLQNAMSMQAQAERERQARVILGESELQVSEKFSKASEKYVNNPTALHLRAMNILLEGMRQNSSIIIVPSSAVETMGLGAMTGLPVLAEPAPQLKKTI